MYCIYIYKTYKGREFSMTDIISYGIIIAAGLAIALLIAYPLRILWKPVLRCIIGAATLIFTNLIGTAFGFSLGVNIFTVLVCAILGVPGFTMLILFRLLL